MDVVLTKDVEKVGKQGTVVNVKPGFARNYLLPQKLALAATPGTLKAIEERARQQAKKSERLKQDAETVKKKIEGLRITLKLAVGEGDAPFGSVSAHDVMDALAQEKVDVPKTAIHLAEPIKSLGVFDVPVRVHPDVTATLKLWVVKE